MEYIEIIRGIIPKKNETTSYLTEKVLETLSGLRQIDNNLFENWYEQGGNKKEALRNKISFEYDNIEQLIKKNWDKKNSDLGCSFSLWTGNKIELSNTLISFRVGLISKNENLNNRIVISLPFLHKLRLTADSVIITDIQKLISTIWETSVIELDMF